MITHLIVALALTAAPEEAADLTGLGDTAITLRLVEVHDASEGSEPACQACIELQWMDGRGELCRHCPGTEPELRCLPYRTGAETPRRAEVLAMVCEDPELHHWLRTPDQSRSSLAELVKRFGVRSLRPLPLETGPRAPGRGVHDDERSPRSRLALDLRVRAVEATGASVIAAAGPSGVVFGEGCSNPISVLPLSEVVGFPSVGVVCQASSGGSGVGENQVDLRVLDLRTPGKAPLKWPLVLGRGSWWRSVAIGSIGATFCHLGVRRTEPAALVLDVDGCNARQAASAADIRALAGRWCFAEAEGWKRCAR